MNTQVATTLETLLPWTNPQFRANPYPWYDVLRQKAPVYFDPNGSNTYNVSRYADVAKFGKHPSLTSHAPAWIQKGAWGRFKDSIIVTDPPEHTALRRLSNKWFTPKMAAQWIEASTAQVNRVIDDLGPNGMLEGFRDLALMPAHHAMCKALGVANDDYDAGSAYMRDAMIGLGAAVTEAEEERCVAAFAFLQDRVDHYIARARKSPQPGALSNWVELVAAGEMTEVQLNEALILFWATGTPNAAYLISGGLELFARQPEFFTMWRDAPEKHHAILNELTRLHTAEMSFERFTTEPLEIAGVTIPADGHIRFLIASANRDPEAFENPHEFRLDRPADTVPHISFGAGPHSCPGTIITQAEATAVFNTLAARVQRIELGGAPIYGHDDRSARYLRLPLRLVR